MRDPFTPTRVYEHTCHYAEPGGVRRPCLGCEEQVAMREGRARGTRFAVAEALAADMEEFQVYARTVRSHSPLGGPKIEPIEVRGLPAERVTGARADLYDGDGNLVARDVEIAPYVRLTLKA
jgi:hypothetical protein